MRARLALLAATLECGTLAAVEHEQRYDGHFGEVEQLEQQTSDFWICTDFRCHRMLNLNACVNTDT